jgi:hypothetical protein
MLGIGSVLEFVVGADAIAKNVQMLVALLGVAQSEGFRTCLFLVQKTDCRDLDLFVEL